MKNIVLLTAASFILFSCGGGSKLSLEEAENVTLNYQGENFTPPPRGVDKLITEIENAGTGLVQDHICRVCDSLDINDPDIGTRLENLSKLGMVSHMRGNSQPGVKYMKQAVALLDTNEAREQFSSGTRSQFDHDYFSALHRAAQLSMEIGNFSESIQYIKRAIKLNENKIKPYKGKALGQYAFLAAAYAELGNVDEAEDALDTAERYYSEMKYKNKRAQRFALKHQQQSLMAKGIIENAQGNLRAAEGYFRQTIDVMAEHAQGQKGWTWRSRAKVMGPYLVNNLLAQGRIAEAEAQAITAIRYSLVKFGYEGYVTASVLQSYIKVLIARERYSDARKMIKVTSHIFDKIGAAKSSIQRVKLKMSLADIYIAEGEWAEAKRIYRAIYDALASEPELRKGLFYENLNWAVILSFTHDLSKAEKVARAVVNKNSDIYGSDHIYTAEAKGVLAMIASSKGQNTEAQQLFESVISSFTQNQQASQSYSSGVNTQRTKLIVDAYLDLLASSYKNGDKTAAKRAFYVAQIVLGKNVQNAVSASAARASIKDPELISLVRKEQDAKRKIEAGYNKLVNNESSGNSGIKSLDKNIKSRVDTLVRARESILAEISDRFPDYENLVRPHPINVEIARSVLSANEALIMTYSGNKNLYVWTLLADGRIHLSQVKANKQYLASTVAHLRTALDLQASSVNEIPEFNVELSHELYNKVLRPSAYLWRSAKAMTIISDGSLSSIPFSVFVMEEIPRVRNSSALAFANYRQVPWLANKYATSYTPSVTTLIRLRNLKVQQKPELLFAGFGNPSFGSTATKASDGLIKSRGVNLSMRGLRKTKAGSLDSQAISNGSLSMLVPLPDTADEVLRVAGALGVTNKGNVFLGTEASENRIKHMALNNRRVLMFATHALLPGDLDGLVQPAIALSATQDKNSANNGLLTMGEVMGLNLNADWVVLSACNTGAESGRGATAVSGLGQAFFYAGARSLLVSHWPVETTSAKQITTGLFDRQVENKSLSRAMALNETVKDLIQNKTYKDSTGKSVFAYAHPVFWAPFTVIGDGSGTLL